MTNTSSPKNQAPKTQALNARDHFKAYRPYVFLFAYWLLLNYLVLHTPFDLFEVEAVSAVEHAQIVQSDASTPQQLSTEAWQPVSLPDDWYHTERTSNQYWYQKTLHFKPEDAEMWAVYLPSVTHNAAVFINGNWVGQGGGFDAPVARNHNRPLLFRFSSQLLKPGDNLVQVKVATSHYGQGLFDRFYVAPVEQLQSAHAWKTFVRVQVIQWFTLIMYVMAAILLSFWLARPQDKSYGLFALLLAIWATHNLNLFVVDIPVSAHVWEAMTMSTLGWTVVTMIFFNHRFVGQRNRRVEQLMLVFAVLGMGIFFLPDIGSILRIGYGVWDSFLIIFGSYAILHLLKVHWATRDGDVFLMLLVGVPILVFGFHDILTVNNLRDRREGLTIQYSVIPAALLFSFFLVRRFVQSLNQAEELAVTLERRVQDRERALQQQFEQLKSLEQQRLLSDERERIMRDMHDGIGGQLVAVVSELQEQKEPLAQRIRQRVEDSLTDLRFVINSLDPLLNDLSTLLGMMRRRLQEQLNLAGIHLEWAVTHLPDMHDMSPRKSLHIMRIVQEAVTNAIKHAEAKQVTLATRMETRLESTVNPSIIIEIRDDGRGTTEGVNTEVPQQEARGMKNMHYRAAELGGQLNVLSDERGTTVRLTLPAQAIKEAAPAAEGDQSMPSA